MTPPGRIAIPSLDDMDDTARRGESLDPAQILRLTAIVRRLCQIITDMGAGHLLLKDGTDG